MPFPPLLDALVVFVALPLLITSIAVALVIYLSDRS